MYPKKYRNESFIRIIYIAISIVLSFLISYTYSDELVYILTKPLKQAYIDTYVWNDSKLNFIFTDLSEAFTASLYVSLFATCWIFFISCIYQLLYFIQPGLYKHEQKRIKNYALISLLIAVSSLLCTYYLILPAACKFFLSYEINLNTEFQVKLEPKILTYIGSSLKFLTWLQIIFQVPSCIFLSIKIGLLPDGKQVLNEITKRRRVYYFFFILFSG